MKRVVALKGMTWKHDRGLAPMLATAASFAASRPDVRIEWEARSLQDFADFPLKQLAELYDMIVLDHPFVGAAAHHGLLLPLDKHMAPENLATLENEGVGASHRSYWYDGHQWALANDAAAQVAAYRPDLLEAAKARVPTTWEEVMELARVRRGFVTLPLLPADALASFITLCANMGEPPFSGKGETVVTKDTGETVLSRLRVLAGISLPEALLWNPIAVWERMSTSDDIAYCPLGFGYSNYARPGYRRSMLSFTNIPAGGNQGPIGSILGGAGLAISNKCRELSVALEYAQWVAGAECQRTVYFQSGGQPGNRRAWTDPEVNRMSNSFFQRTLATLEKAYLRPRFCGFVDFQTAASHALADFLEGKESSIRTLQRLDELYQKSPCKM